MCVCVGGYINESSFDIITLSRVTLTLSCVTLTLSHVTLTLSCQGHRNPVLKKLRVGVWVCMSVGRCGNGVHQQRLGRLVSV